MQIQGFVKLDKVQDVSMMSRGFEESKNEFDSVRKKLGFQSEDSHQQFLFSPSKSFAGNTPYESKQKIVDQPSKRKALIEKFKGNVWDRPLSDKEYTILYAIFRQVSFFIDWCIAKVKNQAVDGGKQPQSQFLRQFSAWDVTMQSLFYLMVAWYVLKFFVWLLL
jgi:hypothetical protein